MVPLQQYLIGVRNTRNFIAYILQYAKEHTPVNPFPGEYVWAFICIFTKINISFILESTGIQQVSLDSTKTALPYEGGFVA